MCNPIQKHFLYALHGFSYLPELQFHQRIYQVDRKRTDHDTTHQKWAIITVIWSRHFSPQHGISLQRVSFAQSAQTLLIICYKNDTPLNTATMNIGKNLWILVKSLDQRQQTTRYIRTCYVQLLKHK